MNRGFGNVIDKCEIPTPSAGNMIPTPPTRYPFACYLLLFLSVAMLLPVVTGANAADALSAGFIYDEFPLTLAAGHRTEAAGPFFYHESRETEQTWAFPPLFSYLRDPAMERKEFDFVYPILTYTRFGGQYRLQFFQLLSFAGGETQTESTRKRFTLYPIYFQQRSSDPAENYTALIPFYGHLQHRMFHDEIFFVMFPFYAKTRKKDMITINYLYPFYHQRYGPGLTGWQLWPFYGTEHKDPMMATNRFGFAETVRPAAE